jgi:hypothetical protein
MCRVILHVGALVFVVDHHRQHGGVEGKVKKNSHAAVPILHVEVFLLQQVDSSIAA